MTDVSNALHFTDPPIDDKGRITVDLPCFGCGYNLRTLHDEDLCPECALPVMRSRDSHLLTFADPEWVYSLAKGVRWIWISILISALLPLAKWAVRFGIRNVGAFSSSYRSLSWYTPVFFYVFSASFYVIGIARFTRRDPAVPPQRGWDEPRVMRAAAFAYSFMFAFWFIVQLTPSMPFTLNISTATLDLLGSGFSLSRLIIAGAMLPYTDTLAKRVVSERQASQIRIVLILMTAFEALFVVLWAMSWFNQIMRSPSMTLSMMHWLAGNLWWAVEAVAVVVLCRFSRHLRRAANGAKTCRNVRVPPTV